MILVRKPWIFGSSNWCKNKTLIDWEVKRWFLWENPEYLGVLNEVKAIIWFIESCLFHYGEKSSSIWEIYITFSLRVWFSHENLVVFSFLLGLWSEYYIRNIRKVWKYDSLFWDFVRSCVTNYHIASWFFLFLSSPSLELKERSAV